jgi:hypothetical protein
MHMSARPGASEWKEVTELAASASAPAFGLPHRRNKSIVLGTFNIRKLGSAAGRSTGAWEFLLLICGRFDLLAIQYDSGVFCFSDLIAETRPGQRYADLSRSQQKAILRKTECDVSDHMPAWIRLPIPGA